MRIDTPIPGRLPTPWLHSFAERPRYFGEDAPAGMGAYDPGVYLDPINDVFRTIYAAQPGTLTVTHADGSTTIYRQPEGSRENLAVGRYETQVDGNVAAGVQGNISSGTGMWVILGIGAALLVFMRKR